MARIPPDDYRELLRLTEESRSVKDRYFAVKMGLTIPDPADASKAAAEQAVGALRELFITNGFSLLDAIVSERGYVLVPIQTHTFAVVRWNRS